MGVLPLGVARRLARTVGWIVSLLPVEPTRVTRTNVQLCFPDLSPGAQRRVTRRSLAETACLLGELGIVFNWPESRWLALAGSPNISALNQALEADRGVLILVPHFGNWEFLGLFLGRLGVMAMYERPHIEALEAPLRAARQRSGLKMWPMDRGGLRAAYRGLARGRESFID